MDFASSRPVPAGFALLQDRIPPPIRIQLADNNASASIAQFTTTSSCQITNLIDPGGRYLVDSISFYWRKSTTCLYVLLNIYLEIQFPSITYDATSCIIFAVSSFESSITHIVSRCKDPVMGELVLEQVSSLTEEQVKHCDFTFIIREEVAKPVTQLALDQPIKTSPVPEFTKDFGFDTEELRSADGLENAIFTLNKDGKVYAYVVARKAWNGMAQLEYICLDKSIRGNGNAHRLFHAILDWARDVGLDFLRLECQSNNVSACRFYKKAGMVFGGYDECLYKAIPENQHETALYFYKNLR